MPDLIDKAETELQQLMGRVVSTTNRGALKISVTMVKGATAVSSTAAAALWNYARNLTEKVAHPEQGKVSLKHFTHLSDGKRAVVQLDDKAVSREFERELKRHGVTWAEQKHTDGSVTFHVQGKDAELIQHSLSVAAARVDEKLARTAPEVTNPAPAVSSDVPAQAVSSTDMPAEPSVAAPSKPDVQLSPRDQTRDKIAKRIDREVKAEKAALQRAGKRVRGPEQHVAQQATRRK